jgi:hypothetical protein
MHLGGSIGLALGGSWPVTECWMVLGGIPAESSSAKRPSAFESSRSMMAVPSGDEDGMRLARADAVTLLSARLVWMRGTMA